MASALLKVKLRMSSEGGCGLGYCPFARPCPVLSVRVAEQDHPIRFLNPKVPLVVDLDLAAARAAKARD
jgi:hypothetical protein